VKKFPPEVPQENQQLLAWGKECGFQLVSFMAEDMWFNGDVAFPNDHFSVYTIPHSSNLMEFVSLRVANHG